MKLKITILLIINISLLLLWRLFLSIDKIDLFLYYDFEQLPRWYAYYTSVYLREFTVWLLVYYLAKANDYIKALSLFFMIMTVLRLSIYWMFKGSISLEVQIVCTILFLILAAIKWRR